MSRARDASPKRSASKSASKKSSPKDIPKDVLVEFQYEEEDTEQFFFCQEGTLTDKEVEMISLWSDSKENILVYYGGEESWDNELKAKVPSTSPLSKEDQIAHALLLLRFGMVACKVLDGIDLSDIKEFEEIFSLPKTRYRHFVVTAIE